MILNIHLDKYYTQSDWMMNLKTDELDTEWWIYEEKVPRHVVKWFRVHMPWVLRPFNDDAVYEYW